MESLTKELTRIDKNWRLGSHGGTPAALVSMHAREVVVKIIDVGPEGLIGLMAMPNG